ncbi:MAG TPA: hypothetical protein VFY74_06050 [Methyloceanibacter sp.]|nr:hypothetical protein [Methyloceanibacter sp.]
MRKVLLVAAAAAIALVGLSANTCGGSEEKAAEPPAPAAAPEPPAAAPEPATEPAEPPATPPPQ